jgi:thiol-disulfide isomerase/thioredoxin
VAVKAAVVGGAVVLLAVGALLLFQAGQGEVPQAQAACGPEGGDDCMPAFEARTLDGETFSSTSLAGKTVLVNFWATWCAPCIEEMPALEAVWKRHKDEGFVIVGILADHAPDGAVRSFVAKTGITYPIVRSTGELEARFGYPPVLPTSILYDGGGHRQKKWAGGINEKTLESSVGKLLGR